MSGGEDDDGVPAADAADPSGVRGGLKEAAEEAEDQALGADGATSRGGAALPLLADDNVARPPPAAAAACSAAAPWYCACPLDAAAVRRSSASRAGPKPVLLPRIEKPTGDVFCWFLIAARG